jgi:hypothetical protein
MIIGDILSICPSTPRRKGHRIVPWPEPTFENLRATFRHAGLAQSAVDSCVTKGTVWLHERLLMVMGSDPHG